MSVFNKEADDFARGARAVIAFPDLGKANGRDADARLEEAAGLAEAIGVEVVDKVAIKVRSPKPATPSRQRGAPSSHSVCSIAPM